jgi:hypothetical protein
MTSFRSPFFLHMILNRVCLFAGLAALPLYSQAASQMAIKAVNKLPTARPNQMIELKVKDLAQLGDLQKVHVRDSSGKEVLCQAVDTDFDARRKPDILIFQVDFGPSEVKTFSVSSGGKLVYKKEQFKAHGRFVRERFDDFAWENDRIAHRMYGKALETWAGEPLTSSTIDIWSKRTPNMVIDDWYMVDNYHSDTGQGADFYSAGASRGCGGNGLWSDNKLWVSKNFMDSRVLTDGPIRVMFELVYDAFDVNGKKVSEVKRVTLDAGSNLDHFESFYKPAANANPGPLTCGIGIKKVADQTKEIDLPHGWLATWEKVEKNQGMQGVAILADPKSIDQATQDNLNHLLLVKAASGDSVSYWSGFAWDKAGQYTDFESWKAYLNNFAKILQSPIELTFAIE